MTDWKTYTIVSVARQHRYLKFELNNSVNYSNGRCDVIRCEIVYPYITYQVGDRIEIDNYLTSYHISYRDRAAGFICPNNENIIRKISSSTNTISASGSSSDISISPSAVSSMNSSGAMDIAQRLSAMVDQSGGKDEYEYKIEVANQDGKTISHSLICRRSKNG